MTRRVTMAEMLAQARIFSDAIDSAIEHNYDYDPPYALEQTVAAICLMANTASTAFAFIAPEIQPQRLWKDPVYIAYFRACAGNFRRLSDALEQCCDRVEKESAS